MASSVARVEAARSEVVLEQAARHHRFNGLITLSPIDEISCAFRAVRAEADAFAAAARHAPASLAAWQRRFVRKKRCDRRLPA